MEKFTLKELRARHNLTQADVAESIGVCVRSVSLWEQKKRCPSLPKLRLLAEYFGVPMDAIDV